MGASSLATVGSKLPPTTRVGSKLLPTGFATLAPKKQWLRTEPLKKRSGRPWGRRAYSALRTPALASRPIQALPDSPLHFMAAHRREQAPSHNGWCYRSGASSLPQWLVLSVGSKLPPTMGVAICREQAPSHNECAIGREQAPSHNGWCYRSAASCLPQRNRLLVGASLLPTLSPLPKATRPRSPTVAIQ